MCISITFKCKFLFTILTRKWWIFVALHMISKYVWSLETFTAQTALVSNRNPVNLVTMLSATFGSIKNFSTMFTLINFFTTLMRKLDVFIYMFYYRLSLIPNIYFMYILIVNLIIEFWINMFVYFLLAWTFKIWLFSNKLMIFCVSVFLFFLLWNHNLCTSLSNPHGFQ